MAQNQSLQHKRSTVANAKPTTSQVAIGELALNLTDKSIYTQTPSGTIIELARDIVDSAFAPASPSEGDLWYDTTNKMVKTWNGTNWVSVTFTGLGVLTGNTSAVPTFTSGSGTLASPYVYTVTTSAGTTVLSNSVTITGLAPNQFVPIVDLNSNSNGGRFQVTNYYADAGGVLKFNIMFADLPASSAGTNYTTNFKIGTGTVYVNITGEIASSFPQSVSFPTGVDAVSTLWTSPGDTLTATGDMLISLDGVTFGAGPLAITTSDTLYTKWAGGPGTGIGIDGANGVTITGAVVDSSTGSTSGSLVIDKTPDAITFTPVTGAGLSTAMDSNSQTVSGINSYAYITSSDTVLAAVDGGTFGAVPSSGTSLYAVSGQTLVLRQTSSASLSTTTTVNVVVGGSSTSFAVTTAGVGTINTPSFTSPANGSTGIFAGATLTSSAYAVTGVVGTHLNTDWEIYEDAALSTNRLVDSSMASTTNLTTWTPIGLEYTTQYWARVRYRSDDSTPVVSEWSATNTWTTGVQAGINWTNRTGLSTTTWGTTDDALSVVWNGSQYLVVGVSGKVATSTDGVTWAYQAGLRSTSWGTADDANSVVWNGSQYLVVGQGGKAATSTDGVTWTYRSGLASTMGSTANSVIWANGQYLVVGLSGKVATSPNGTTWTNRTGLSSTAWGTTSAESVVWNGSQYLVVGGSGKVATSPDGTTWTNRTGLSSGTWGTIQSARSVVWNGSQYVVVGQGGKVATSPDGVTWTYRAGLSSTAWGTDTAWEVIWDGIQYLVVGQAGKVATSTNGSTWTNRTGLSSTAWGSGSSSVAYSVVWNGSQYLVVGMSGKVATSP